MNQAPHKYIIVGAGLSGLTASHKLYGMGETDFLVLESRSRVGGRILTHSGIDLGATWFQDHHYQVLNLLEELGIDKFHQYSTGQSVLVYSTMAPEHYFESDPNTPSAYRIAGSSTALVDALVRPFANRVKLDTTVTAIRASANMLSIETDQGVFRSENVIVTVPPKIAGRISFFPELPEAVGQAMERTHTWMSNAIKVGLTFKKPFWREKNLSGTVIGQAGAVTELYDHTDTQNKQYALMGFVNEGLRDVSAEARKQRILDYLITYLGKEIAHYLSYEEKDWSQDRNTSCETIKSIYMSPSYGNPVFQETYLEGRLVFSGAETSPVYGGYMDGAIFSGNQAVDKITQNLGSRCKAKNQK